MDQKWQDYEPQLWISLVEHHGIFPFELAQHSQALIHSGHHLLHGSTNAVGLSAAWLQRQMLDFC